ncbi:MAG TPA: hypothetical protein VKG78_06930 [Opitutaceae bacterium]|nr:hypothetical protein [Opitutaceae bacterium]
MNPFLQGRKTAAGAALVAPKTTSALRLPSMVRAPHAHDPKPSVDVVKEGDRVVRLVVKCSCGERIEVECLYSS